MRKGEDFEGNGYDWSFLALVFINEKIPELADEIEFDPETSMFCVYSVDKLVLEKFSLAFKETCENNELINDLFFRAELD